MRAVKAHTGHSLSMRQSAAWPAALNSNRTACQQLNHAQRCAPARSYDVDVEPPPRAPKTAPNFGGAPPPPPPPPPPKRAGLQGPSRREGIFMAFGAFAGAAGVTAYYTTQYDLSPGSAEAALDDLLDDPDFLDMVADEVLLRDYEEKLDTAGDEADALASLGEDLKQLVDLVDND